MSFGPRTHVFTRLASVVGLAFLGFAGTPDAQETFTSDARWQLRAAIVDQERLLAESVEGRRILEEVNRKGNELRAENGALQAELEEEERNLTALRNEMDGEEFRRRANEFDLKVNSIRTIQRQKLERLNAEFEQSRASFYRKAESVMLEMMRERGIGMIVARQAVLLATSAADITDDVVVQLDQAYRLEQENEVDRSDDTQ